MKRLLWLSIVIFWILPPPALSAEEQQGRIIGGSAAVSNRWPWVVSLQYASSGNDHYSGHFCGGSLIAPDWVITAAHCVDGSNPWDVSVVAGISNLRHDRGSDVAVKRIIVHPDYEAEVFVNDLALLQLTSPVNNTDTIELVGIRENLIGKWATATGWGNMKATSDSQLFPFQLQQVKLPIVSNRTCNEGFEQAQLGASNPVNKTMLCAGYLAGGKDTCQGDSGGPLMVWENGQWLLAGLTSWGEGCASGYGVYTRLSWFVEYIRKTIQIDYFKAADSDGNNIITIRDKIRQRKLLQNQTKTYLNDCWLPALTCGDLNGDKRVDWRDLEQQGQDTETGYQRWVREIWAPEQGEDHRPGG